MTDREKKKMQLVAPAGGWPHLVAALNAGADAVYLGYSDFGARAYAPNFDFPMLKKAVALAHERNARVFLTLNTLIKDSELEEVAHFLKKYLQICQDGIIIQDMGVYKILKDLFPGVRVHASTQLNIHNLDSVKMLESMGVARVVLAREMTIDLIRQITNNSAIEVEVFAHGSQCYSFSGHCYLSSFVSGRSGNRGRCSQPCRMKYRLLRKEDGNLKAINNKHRYYLSKKDLAAIDMIPRLAESGVNALKIEGRMKTPEYVAIVTSIYRKYIDLHYDQQEEYKVEDRDRYKLGQIFLRDSNTGYMEEEYPADIVNLKTSGSIGSFVGRIDRVDFNEKKKIVEALYINAKIPVYIGDLIEIWTNKGNERLTVSSVEEVKKGYLKIPLGKDIWISKNDRVFKYFDHKLDGEAKAYYLYHKRKPKVKPDPGQPMLQDYELNFYLSSNNLVDFKFKKEKIGAPGLSVNVYDLDSIKTAADNSVSHIIYRGEAEYKLVELQKYCQQKGSILFLSIPETAYQKDWQSLNQRLNNLAEAGMANYEVNNLGAFYWLKHNGVEADNIIIGRGLNIFNSLGAQFISSLVSSSKICELELSNELNLGEASVVAGRNTKLKFSMFGHGYFPVMIAKFRLPELDQKYHKANQYYLEDIKGFKFRLGSDLWGNMMVFNSKKICTLFDLERIVESDLSYIRLDTRFTDVQSQKKIISSYSKAIDTLVEKGGKKYHNFIHYLAQDILFKDYTRGHLLRGVK